MSAPAWYRCSDCGKRGYLTRKAARQVLRTEHPGSGMSTYLCRTGSDLYHVGHPTGRERKSERPPSPAVQRAQALLAAGAQELTPDRARALPIVLAEVADRGMFTPTAPADLCGVLGYSIGETGRRHVLAALRTLAKRGLVMSLDEERWVPTRDGLDSAQRGDLDADSLQGGRQ